MTDLKIRVFEMLLNGHFMVVMPDGTSEDYDEAIPDYNVRRDKGPDWVCIDSNGSEPVQETIKSCPNGHVTFVLLVNDREYKCGTSTYGFSEAEILVEVSSIDSEDTLHISSARFLTIDGEDPYES